MADNEKKTFEEYRMELIVLSEDVIRTSGADGVIQASGYTDPGISDDPFAEGPGIE